MRAEREVGSRFLPFHGLLS